MTRITPGAPKCYQMNIALQVYFSQLSTVFFINDTENFPAKKETISNMLIYSLWISGNFRNVDVEMNG